MVDAPMGAARVTDCPTMTESKISIGVKMKKEILILLALLLAGCENSSDSFKSESSTNASCKIELNKHYYKRYSEPSLGSDASVVEILYLAPEETLVLEKNYYHFTNIHTEAGSKILLGSVENASVYIDVDQSCTFLGDIVHTGYTDSLSINCIEDMTITNIESQGTISLSSMATIKLDGTISTASALDVAVSGVKGILDDHIITGSAVFSSIDAGISISGNINGRLGGEYMLALTNPVDSSGENGEGSGFSEYCTSGLTIHPEVVRQGKLLNNLN